MARSPAYGSGTQLFAPDGSRVGHTCGAPGVANMLELDRDHDLIVVVIGNQNVGANYVYQRARQLSGAGAPTQNW